MPVFRDIAIILEMEHVLRLQGMSGCARPRQEVAALTHELMAGLEGRRLLEPAIVYETYPVSRLNDERLNLGNGTTLNGSLPAERFPPARRIAAIICTIGPRLEQAASDCFGRGEPLRGLLLDGIGNAALDSAATVALRLLREEASLQGCGISGPISPGVAGFSISEQQTLFKLVHGERIGVNLTSSGVMFPCKSLSMVVGIMACTPEQMPDSACNGCDARKTCRYRTCSEEKSNAKVSS